MMRYLFYILLLILFSQCKPKTDPNTQFPVKPKVPSSIKTSHVYLLEQILKMTLFKDSSGRVAIKLEELMQHHFKEEEDFILPPLGLLPSLAKDQVPEQSKELILLSENVETQLDHMSAEHQLIQAFLEELKQASNKENLPEIIEFENEVIKHASSEEEIYFPASILIGKYLKLKTTIKP